MDFLLQSYRKQKKWIRLRQLLLLLSRIAVAFLLIAMLCGWTGGRRALSVLGGTTTHHVVILDDSYSMGDASLSNSRVSDDSGLPATAYGRALGALQNLTHRLASDDSNHQLTVMRASRASMAVRGGVDSGDAAADISAQTITGDGRLTSRVMSTSVSSIRCELTQALDLTSELIESTPADSTFVYVASDFRHRDWGTPERLAQSLQKLPVGTSVRMIDCAANPGANLAVTELTPLQDVWVSGVPVVVNVTVKNYSKTTAKNIPLQTRVIRYGDGVSSVDPTRRYSGEVESLPTMVIESLPPGGSVTKTFQVYVTERGTHAIEASLPDDVLMIDNTRSCTLPLSDVERVLVIQGSDEERGAYHLSTVLDPGSQVRIGAVPEVKPAAFLRSATWESLAPYRAIYLINVQEIGANAADALNRYVRRGGGLAMFLGGDVSATSYNENLLDSLTPDQSGTLLPGRLEEWSNWGDARIETGSADLMMGEDSSQLLGPLESSSENPFAMVGITRSWELKLREADRGPLVPPLNPAHSGATESNDGKPNSPDPAIRVRRIIDGRDGRPLVTLHDLGRGRVVTVMTGLDLESTNWTGDPTFVVFMLQTNAMLWSGAAPPTQRPIDARITKFLPVESYSGSVMYVPAVSEPPRVPIDVVPLRGDLSVESGRDVLPATVQGDSFKVFVDPQEMVINGNAGVETWLTPGVSEWALMRIDGSLQIEPIASVIAGGEGDLARADQAAISQSLLPTEVRFVTSDAWNNQHKVAGSSTLTLLLLALLGLILAAEQSLAYWASYHVKGGQA